MKTIAKQTSAETRLAALESESHIVINTYIEQVKVNAYSPNLKKLKNRLKEIRAEQWKLVENSSENAILLGWQKAA